MTVLDEDGLLELLDGAGYGLGELVLGSAGAGRLCAVEAAGLHGGDGLRVLHEGLPDEAGAEIFRHEQTDAKVDAEDIGVVPVARDGRRRRSRSGPRRLCRSCLECAQDADAARGRNGSEPAVA